MSKQVFLVASGDLRFPPIKSVGLRKKHWRMRWDLPFASLDMKFDGHTHSNLPRVTVLLTVNAMASMCFGKSRRKLR
jgi:hypothetical protein